jgi:hypothetical protein
MRRSFRKLAGAAIILAIALASFSSTSIVLGQETEDQVKIDMYKRFTDNRIPNPRAAYQAGKDYLAKYGKDNDQYAKYISQWVSYFEREDRKLKLPVILYNEKNFAEAYRTGAQILVDEPDYLRTQIDLGYGGYLAATYCAAATAEAGDTIKKIAQRCNANPEEVSRLNSNAAVDNPLPTGQAVKLPPAAATTFSKEAMGHAKSAIQLIESGKAPSDWAPFKGKDDTLAYLYYTVASLNLKTAPEEAIDPLLKAASFESDLKKTPSTYYFLAYAYESGPYKSLSAAYQKNYADKPETPESKAALEKLNVVIDRIIDAYARAINAAGTDPKNAQSRAGWMTSLTNFYKFRHGGSDAGLNEMIASALSKPLPPKP